MRAWRRWVAVSETRETQRAAMKRAMVQWGGRQLATGVRTWLAEVVASQRRVQTIARSAVQRKTTAWRSLLAFAEERLAKLAMVQQALKAWVAHEQASSWRTWLAAAEKRKEGLRLRLRQWVERKMAQG